MQKRIVIDAQLHQIPDFADNSTVRWTIPDDDLMITLDHTTGMYSATYLEWSDQEQDWIDGKTLSSADSLRLACHYQLILP